MVKMNIPSERLAKFQTLEELEKEIFTDEQIKQIHEKALKRSALRHQLSDAISKSVAAYMARNEMGFNDLKKQLGMSSATVSRIMKGDANLTLDTLADLMQVTGLHIDIK